ncbi:ATP-binding protein [uncultured Nocardioides sp.]|uniref:sensor histidine kinase n=1 Tax=uncultured Nocardioides sp. TaxID=198441 RepID=UPI002618190B|nr:ATP-binding protein [uncultured Nocardioides sp.]
MSVTSDEKRVLEIDRYHVLLAPPRADLVALVEVAAQVAQVPLATINLITDTEQHQIATAGFDASICAREDSMCNLVLHEKEPVIVPDASQDPRFKDNPFVTGEIGDVRFYATHQLRTPGDIVIGTLCVFDTEPRDLGDDQEQALLTLADRVVDLLELELRTRELTSAVAELGAAHAELERSNQVLTAFAGQVAHDLRNPLSAVRMSLDLLQEQVESPDLDAETLAYVATRATSGAQRMQSLIDDLLSYARVGGQMGRGEVDLEAVVSDVRADLAVALEGAEVTVGPLPTVTGDEVQLRAVLQNLVANSAKFAAPGERARIEVRGTTTADGWRLEVVDHGLGVPEADRGRVFLPLARAHEAVEGHGIGLATVRRIVDAHHGRIGIDETPGGGATVWIELPR